MEIKGFNKNFVWAIISLLYILSSCINTKKSTYFNGVNDGTLSGNTPIPESIIQKNDLLSISVSSLNPEASAIFNGPNIPTITAAGVTPVVGYLVSADGTIQFPILGNIKAQGLTKEQLKETIRKRLLDQKLLTDPIVLVRYLNFRVTVLGEVNKPSVLSVPSEKISLLEAIGLAGDLTIYGKRENILVIREENGDKTIKRLNLNSEEILSSPYYYLKSNDIIYVEPNKARIASAGRGQQWIPIILSGMSVIIILADRVFRNN